VAATRSIAFSLVLICAGSDAGAQTCGGGLSFNFAPLQLGVAPAWSPQSSGIAASGAFGADRLFGVVSAKVHRTRQSDALGFAADATIGVNQPVRRDNRLHVCPMLSAGYVRAGPTKRPTVGARVAFGWLAHNGPELAVVATAGVSIGRRALSGWTDPFLVPVDKAASSVDFGVGFIVRSRYVLTPRIAFPSGDEGHPTLAMHVSYGLRRE
jgi:hypothetical protein